MSRKGEPIDPRIKCPWCGATYPNIRRNGYYMRDEFEIPQYYCKRCKKGFSGSVIKIRVLKPPYEVEIGHTVKIEVKIRVERELQAKEVKCKVLKDKRETAQIKLNKEEDFYKGVWNIKEVEKGKYTLEVMVMSSQGYGAIQTKVVKVVQHYDALIMKIAVEFELDPYLIKAMVFCESSFIPDKVSKAGAVGLMQLMPKTAASVGVKNSYDPEQNIKGGIKYFKNLLVDFKDNIEIALAAYNAGPDKIRKRIKSGKPWPRETQKHVPKVLKYWKEFSEKAKENYVQ